jgi:sulfatase maturation enzyme AslB (radical SAM superfamily)
LIDEVLISYHLDKNPENINKNIFPLGSTYQKVMKTVQKARENGVFIRTNTVIGTFNIERIDKIVNDIVNDIKPSIINFLPVNLFEESEKHGMEKYIDYGVLRPILKKNIDFIKENLPESDIFVRFMPFCDMEGYEQHIVGTL